MKRHAPFLLCLLFIYSPLQAEEKVFIHKIIDTNLFQTDTGQLISLANIATISIHDPDLTRAKFAQAVLDKTKHLLESRPCTIEQLCLCDSVIIVLMWQSALVGNKSINGHYLQKGWGFFKENPGHANLDEFRSRAERARIARIGVYDERNVPVEWTMLPNAFWFSAGIGFSGDGRYKRRKQSMANLGAVLSYRHRYFYGDAGGYLCMNSVTRIQSLYSTLGVNFHDRIGELMISVGPSFSRWSHDTESTRGIVKSDPEYGALAKIQALIHTQRLLGMGITIAGEFKNDWVTYSMTFFLCWGEWNY